MAGGRERIDARRVLRVVLSVAAIAAGAGCVALARLRLGDKPVPAADPTVSILLWLLGTALVVAGCWPHAGRAPLRARRDLASDGEPALADQRSRVHAPHPVVAAMPRWLMPLGVAILTVAALALRLYDLEGIPWIMSGDEGSVGQAAISWRSGAVTNPFITGWSSHPLFYFILQSWSVRLFGQTLFALRVTSALAGAFTIPLLYLFARRHWGPDVGFAAAAVLTGLAVHIHYSRLSIDPAFDPLFALTVLGAVIEGGSTTNRHRARLWFLLAALVFGVSLYFWGSRLLAVVMLAVAAHSLLYHRRRFGEMLRHWFAFAAVGLALDAPLFAQFFLHPNDFFARMNQVGVFQTGHVARAAEPMRFVWEQLRVSLLAFNGSPDTSLFYDLRAPMLRSPLPALFAIGVLYALTRALRPAEFSMLTLTLGTMIFGSALIVTPPQSHHFVISFPAVALFIALGLVIPSRLLLRFASFPRVLWAGALVAAVVYLAAADARWYFADFSRKHRFGDINTEVAHVLGHRLQARPDLARYYFFGPGRMFAGFPSIPYLSSAQGYDVHQPPTAPPDFILSPGTVFVFLPERASELEQVQLLCPEGTLERVDGLSGMLLFYWYEPRAGCQEAPSASAAMADLTALRRRGHRPAPLAARPPARAPVAAS